MNNEELQKAWDKICYCCSHSFDDYPSDELYMISEVLTDYIAYEENQAISDKTRDKYRWHDLRKNPNDLPCKDGTYRCVFKDDIHTYFDCDYRNGIGFGKECFYAHNELTGSPIEYYFECFDEDDEVIAWQDIELFEVDK